MDTRKEKTSLDILDSVPATPSPPSQSSPSIRPGGFSMDLSTSSSSSSPFGPIEPESLSSTPRQSSSSNLPATSTTITSTDTTTVAAIAHTLTSNTSFYDIPITDAFTELLERHVPIDERPERQQQLQPPPLLNLDDSKPDNLATMVMNHHWRAVARDTRQKLVQTPPTELNTIFQLWYIRLLALYQLGLYQLASAEFEKLGTDDVLTTLPDVLPFEIRVLWAVLPFQLGHPLSTLELLSRLAIQCQKKQQQQRELQVYLIMVTRLIQMNDAHGAAKILQAVLHRVTAMDPHFSCRVDLMTSLGRLYLQLGDLATAERMYTEIEALQKQYPALDTPLLQETIQTNRALLHMAKGDWVEAKQILEHVIQQYPENLTAVNNLAVCMVYSGHLTQSMELLDKTTQQHPTTAGTSQVTVMNLCTLYELRFDGAGLVDKKVNVMKQIARWVGDSFNPQCIKLQ